MSSLLPVHLKGLFATFPMKRGPRPADSEALHQILQMGNNISWQDNVE